MAEIEKIDAARLKELRRLEKKLGVEFKNLELLNLALTHTSYSREMEDKILHNERLEFLGDAVLELASSTYLFEHFKDFSEGELTKARASIVCQPILAKLAAKIGLGEMLLLGRGEEASGGRERTTNLEDVFEAVIGAIYLDCGWEVARDYVMRQLAPEFKNVELGKNLKDYKSHLQEVVQSKPGGKIEYIELDSYGPDHMKTFDCAVKINGKIFGKGTGKSKKIAEQMAAQKALEKLDKKY